MPQHVTESRPLAEATSTTTAGRMLIQIITPGLGSSGYYSPAVLEAAATDRLVTRGTAMFLDHASQNERQDRPERSVRDIAGFFTEDARWTGEALVAEAQILAPYRELLTDEHMVEHIGLSISGSATDITEAEVDGRRVPVIEGLAEVASVDFVTRAGRGGRVLGVLESAQQRTVAEVRQALAAPADVPVSPAGSTTESQGGTMPEIEEARLRQLETDAGRVTVLESERDTAVQRAEAAERRLAEATAQTAARPVIAAVLAEGQQALPASTVTRLTEALVAAAPRTDAGTLDEAALRTAAATARTAAETELAEALAAAGVGRVRGAGDSTHDSGEVSESDYDRRSASVFGRTSVKEA